MKFAANLNSLWRELPYLDRFSAAAAAGFTGVSVPMPYEMPAKDVQRAALAMGLSIVQISAPPPNYTGGPRGFAAVPGAEARFAYDLRRALRYCDALRVSLLHVMAGPAEGVEAHRTLVTNLQKAALTLPEKITMTLQPQAQKGAFLQDYQLAARIIAEVGAPNLGLQFHSHHAQLLHKDAVDVLRSFAPVIRHVQIADDPMGPPGSGQIDFEGLFSTLQDVGYTGWVVADYLSDGPTDDTLGWMQHFSV